jgi:hypothetical protein
MSAVERYFLEYILKNIENKYRMQINRHSVFILYIYSVKF